MSNPQQPELARSRKVPFQDQDAVAGVLDGQEQPGTTGPGGPVPPENQPGHHPAHDQDKPDLNAFAEKLGVVDAAVDDDRSSAAADTADGAGDDAHGGGSTAGTAAGGATRTTLLAGALAAGTAVLVILGVVARRRRGGSPRA